MRASRAGVVTRLGERKWRIEPAGEALLEPGVDTAEEGVDFEGVALVTRTWRFRGGEVGDCTLTVGGECRGVRGYAVDTGRGFGGGGLDFLEASGVSQGARSGRPWGRRGRSRERRIEGEGVDWAGCWWVVMFSKRERSDDTGLMDVSSVARSSSAMAAVCRETMRQSRRGL